MLRKADLGQGSTEALIGWMHNFRTLNDHNLAEATVSIVIMLRTGVVDRDGMERLCAVAPKCIDYMAMGSGFSHAQMLTVLRHGNLQARTALRKMLAIANARFRGENEYELVREARELPAD